MTEDHPDLERRTALAAVVAGSAAFATFGSLLVPAHAAEEKSGEQKSGSQDSAEDDVSASEDMMREHGVLRRTLIVYRELSDRLPHKPQDVDPAALADAAKLFRDFGEDYHEKLLEEQHVFPEVLRYGGVEAKLVQVLLSQHARGREITDYIYNIGKSGRIGTGQAEPLARALAGMVRMYESHTAWEDTVVFPGWKKKISKQHLEETSELFDKIEQEHFGKDEFDDAVARIARIEQTFGLADLDAFTAPPPPKTG